MDFAPGLQVDYLPWAGHGTAGWDGVLGVATFDCSPAIAADAASADVPVADVRTPVLGSDEPVCEIWRTAAPVQSGRQAGVRFRHGADVLFGCISVPETNSLPDTDSIRHLRNSRTSALHAATDQAYREIFTTLDELDYPHLLRVWNYLPQINLDTHGIERYRQFNSARREALTACERAVTGSVPAACALGSATGSPLVIYFLASRTAPTLIENPRQVSAYRYPAEYGPKPTFSRASVLRGASGAMLFISGTASIVGHKTVHIGDVSAQTLETLANIEALLDEANRVDGRSRFTLGALAYKVYVRNTSDLSTIQSQLRAALGSGAQIMYLRADICRQDLLV
jgi:chorismate lyase / 3-hydroxybenzoate synthase